MRIRFQTKVSGDYQQVFNSFDQKLFEYLKPPGQLAELIRFDGSEKGDLVHIRFKFPTQSDWVSEIVENSFEEDKCYFIDVGTQLPFGLRSWRHKHIVHKADENSLIEDSIKFEGTNWLIGLFLYPGLWFTFYLRKGKYRKYFNTKAK